MFALSYQFEERISACRPVSYLLAASLCMELTDLIAWIAHGMLDSIVDGFFPFVQAMEAEIVAVENIVFSDGVVQAPTKLPALEVKATSLTVPKTRDSEKPFLLSTTSDEKQSSRKDVASIKPSKTHFSLPRPTLPLTYHRFKQTLHRTWSGLISSKSTTYAQLANNPTSLTLKRMTRVRRLVTSVGRVLVTKSEVVTQLQKRLLTADEHGHLNTRGDDVEVAIYMADVQGQLLPYSRLPVH